MKFNNRNERKKYILALLNHSTKTFTSREIADLCYPVSYSSICTSLKNYYEQGLLRRKRKNEIFFYNITQKGIERLEYLIGDTSIKSQIELLVRERIRL